MPILSKYGRNKQQGNLILIVHVDGGFIVSHLNAVQEETRQHHISLSGVWAKLALEDEEKKMKMEKQSSLGLPVLNKKEKCPKIREELQIKTPSSQLESLQGY